MVFWSFLLLESFPCFFPKTFKPNNEQNAAPSGAFWDLLPPGSPQLRSLVWHIGGGARGLLRREELGVLFEHRSLAVPWIEFLGWRMVCWFDGLFVILSFTLGGVWVVLFRASL